MNDDFNLEFYTYIHMDYSIGKKPRLFYIKDINIKLLFKVLVNDPDSLLLVNKPSAKMLHKLYIFGLYAMFVPLSIIFYSFETVFYSGPRTK